VYLCSQPHSFSQAIFLASLFPPLLSFASTFITHPLRSLDQITFSITGTCWFVGLILSLFGTCSAGILATLRTGNQKRAGVHGEQNDESRVDTLYSQAFRGIAVSLFTALVLFIFGLVVFLCWLSGLVVIVLVPTFGVTFWFLRFTVKLILLYIRKK